MSDQLANGKANKWYYTLSGTNSQVLKSYQMHWSELE